MPKKKREHGGARWGVGGDRLVTFAGVGAEVLCEFVGHADKRVGIGGAGFVLVMLGQTAEYWRSRSSHFSSPGSVSGSRHSLRWSADRPAGAKSISICISGSASV